MAASLINTECKRYGCMKNLLACFANCRYNTRCDDLRSEIESKTEQAEKDINLYLSQRGDSPVSIQFLKRGLKFAKAAPYPSESVKPKQIKAPLKGAASPRPKLKPVKTEKSEKCGMEKKQKNTESRTQSAVSPASPVNAAVEKKAGKNRSKPRRGKDASQNGRSPRKSGKTYIIVEGRTASIVDEHGLMQHILSQPSSDARYFEATEVVARVQIVAMR
jgi:hypothetical protein